MDSQQYERLRKNLSLLHENVDAMELVPYLIEQGVLDFDHKNDLESKARTRDKMDRLLEILKSLPPGKRAYNAFIDALKSTGLSDYEDYASRIENTPVASDASVKSTVDPSHCEGNVNKILRENFANKENEETSIHDVRKVLDDNGAFPNTSWSNQRLTRYICKVAFVGVEQIKRQRRPKSKTIFFKHLGRILTDNQASSRGATSLGYATDTETTIDLQSLSASELKGFLIKEFEKKKVTITTDPLDELERESINGEVLLSLNEDDMKQVMPSSTFGQRRTLRLIIDQYKQRNEVTKEKPFQKFRAFDKEVRPTDRYVLGRLVDTKVNSRGKKTTALRNFHSPDFEVESDLENFVLKECVKFSAACINTRQNGTIYFGISPDDLGGRMKGEIVGVKLSLKNLDDCIPAMFFSNKASMIRSCVRNLKAIPIIGDCNVEPLFVLELDVVPASSFTEAEMIRVNALQMHCLQKECKVSDPIFTFSECGMPQITPPNERDGNTKISPMVTEQRKKDELKGITRERPMLIHLRNHLTGGLDELDDDLYVFLLLGPSIPSDLDVRNMEFIRHLQPAVVFDFESDTETTNSIYRSLEEQEEVTRVVTLNDFDERKKDQKEIKAFLNELVECDFTNWVFCNGYGQMEKMEPIDWNKKRSHAFQTAFTHYIERFQQDRVLIIICLFSTQYKVMLDPSEVILRRFPDQWILLSETQIIADEWQATFTQRQKVDNEDLRERCIVSLSWGQINNGITTWCGGKKDTKECKIPESSGGLIKVDNKIIKEWSDIEVLSALDPVDTNDDEDLNAQIKQAEEQFYRGGQVSWLNFFSGHVCYRKIHQPLQRRVEDALEGKGKDEVEKILTTYLFHEPGAGGSTSARHILWSLRTKYRCCVVRDINNPSQAADQLTEIFLFRDENPKPILVLLDNEDEDKVFQLRVNLERKARDYDSSIIDVFCALLICSRMFDVPVRRRNCSMEVLKQSLGKEDRIWFCSKIQRTDHTLHLSQNIDFF